MAKENAISGQRWLILTEAFRLAISPQCLALSLLGVLLVSMAWSISGAIFLRDDDATANAFHNAICRLHYEIGPRTSGPAGPLTAFLSIPQALDPAKAGEPMIAVPIDPIIGAPYRIMEPFRRLFVTGTSWSSFSYYLTGGGLSLAIWAVLGGAISRTAVVRIGLGQHVGMRDSVQFGAQQWPAFFAAPTLPMAGIALVGLPFLFLGFMMRLDLGVLLASILWIPVVIGCVLMSVLSLGLCFGWPLMWGTISTENSDAFDAISRSYAYTFQRPLHYLFYALVAAVLGTLGWLLAWWFAEVTISFGFWAISWGAGAARLGEIRAAIGASEEVSQTLSSSLWMGAKLMGLVISLVRTTATSFSYSFFWAATAAIYLLLRAATDQTELDDIVFDEQSDFEFGLPVLSDPEAELPDSTPESSPSDP